MRRDGFEADSFGGFLTKVLREGRLISEFLFIYLFFGWGGVVVTCGNTVSTMSVIYSSGNC